MNKKRSLSLSAFLSPITSLKSCDLLHVGWGWEVPRVSVQSSALSPSQLQLICFLSLPLRNFKALFPFSFSFGSFPLFLPPQPQPSFITCSAGLCPLITPDTCRADETKPAHIFLSLSAFHSNQSGVLADHLLRWSMR